MEPRYTYTTILTFLFIGILISLNDYNTNEKLEKLKIEQISSNIDEFNNKVSELYSNSNEIKSLSLEGHSITQIEYNPIDESFNYFGYSKGKIVKATGKIGTLIIEEL